MLVAFALVWFLSPFVLVGIGVFRARGKMRAAWIGGAAVYVLVFMVVPTLLTNSVRGGSDGPGPTFHCVSSPEHPCP